jgi:uncharacterized protein YndB with AHSA1/START domain
VKLQRSVVVACSKDEAFSLFTDGINEWWPLREGFSYGVDRCASIHLEPRPGGRFFERFVDGDEFQVGTVTVCEAPDRIVFTWAPPVWAGATEVEVRFLADAADATTVHVEHRGFDSLGTDAQSTRDGFASGWPAVLDAFSHRAAAGGHAA